MGGYGSGRRNGAKCTDDYRALDVRRWQRDGLLTPGQSFGWNWYRGEEVRSSVQVRTETDRVIFNYWHLQGRGESRVLKYPVQLDWTPCTYGSRRPWFLCPGRGCGRRVALLYLGGAGIFACRHCNRLAYRCQREAADDRAARRAEKIRERLGWPPGILHYAGRKPKGMRWRTFERLKAEHDVFSMNALAGLSERFGVLEQRLDGISAKLPCKR